MSDQAEAETKEIAQGMEKKTYKQLTDEIASALRVKDERIKELERGENDWWRRRWLSKDEGKQLQEIRTKWLTAFQCAENYQKMYDETLVSLVSCREELKHATECWANSVQREEALTIQLDKYRKVVKELYKQEYPADIQFFEADFKKFLEKALGGKKE